jgi:hypothetical protein
VTNVDPAARRMTAAMLFLVAVIVISSIWRRDDLVATVGYATATVVGGGLVIGCYLWARRKD